MKSIGSLFGVIAILVAGCGTMTDAKHTPTIGEWSEVVGDMRGRLVVEPTLDEKGRTQATIYLELQNLAHLRQLIFTRGADCFTWKLTNVGKEALPRWQGGLPWIYDFAQMSYPITLPSRATLRMPVSSATYHILLPKFPEHYGLPSSSLVLEQDAPNNPWHLISGSSTESYFLSATFKSAGKSEAPTDRSWWNGPLSLPAVRLPTDASPRRDVW